MKRQLLLACILFGLLSTALAQDETPPLYFTADGYLYAWQPGLSQPEQITTEGYIHKLVHAPIGDRIAFVWHATESRPFDRHFYAYSDQFEGDTIYILEDGELRTLNPTTTVIPSPPYIRISDPTWAADGERFAWTQGVMVQTERGDWYVDEAKLRYFDIREGQVYGGERLSEGYFISGGDAGESALALPTWVANHIATFYPFAGPEIMMRLDNTAVSQEATRMIITDVVYAGGVDVVDVMTEAGPYIGVFYYKYNQWDLINPITLSSQALDTVAEIYSPNAPETSLVWRYDPVDERWQLFNNRGDALAEVAARFWHQPIALSPDGQAAAYVDEHTLHVIWQDGRSESLTMDALYGLAWGPMQWRVAEDVMLPDIEAEYYFDETDCPLYDIAVGMRGTLQERADLYAHSEPLRYVMHTLPEGTPVTILDGPRCRDAGEAGYKGILWQVNAYDLTGWIMIDNASMFSPRD